MVDALNPENPNPVAPTPRVTQTQQHFETIVDEALRQHYTPAGTLAGLDPRALLSYAAGALEGAARLDFEQQLERSLSGTSSLVSTLKLARPLPASAPFTDQLKSTLTRQLIETAGADAKPEPVTILHTFSRACHEAVLRNDAALSELPDQLDDDDRGRREAIIDGLSGATRALAHGMIGELDAAMQTWSSDSSHPRTAALTGTIALANSESPAAAGDDVLSSLTKRLAAAPHDAAALLEILLDFAHSQDS